MPVHKSEPVGSRGWELGLVGKGRLADCHRYQSCPGSDQGGKAGGGGERGAGPEREKKQERKRLCLCSFSLLVH